MATEAFWTKHTNGKTVYFRFLDLSTPASPLGFDFSDGTWKALGTETTPKLAATEIAAAGDANESLYAATQDLATLYSSAAAKEFVVQSVDDLATDEVIGESAIVIAAGVLVPNTITEGRLAELDAANLPADVDAILADTGTDGVVLATDSVDAAALAADAVAEIQSGLSTLTAQQVWEYVTRTLSSYIDGAYTLTCTVTDGTDPISGITVWLKDNSGNLRSPPVETDASGQVSWTVPDGTWVVYIESTPAYSWDASTKSVTISGADGSASFTGTAWSAPVPTTAEYCVLYGYVKDLSGTDLASETDAIRVVPEGQYRNSNTGLQAKSESADTNASGYFEVQVLRQKYMCSGTEASGSGTGTVKIFIDKAGVEKSGVAIPDSASKNVWDLIRGV